MIEITEIAPEKRRLYALRFSEDYLPQNAKNKDGALLLDRDYCDENGFKIGLKFGYEEIDAHYRNSELRRAKQKAMWLLEQQDYPSGKLLEKLRKDYSFEISAAAVARLTEVGLINDCAYARRAAQALINKGTPTKRLAFALSQKGVDTTLAKEIAAETECDDKKLIYELLQTKYARKLSNETDLRKTVAALLRRGFSYSDIKSVMGDMSDEFYYGDE